MKVQCTVEGAGDEHKNRSLIISSDNIATNCFVVIEIMDTVSKDYRYIAVDGRETIKAIENAMNC